jgi:hypothetical protein
MNIIRALIERVRGDYQDAQSLAEYLRRRLCEKSTWGAVGGAIIAANELKPAFAACSIAVALVVALLPTS